MLILVDALAWPVAAVAIALGALAALVWAFWFWRHPTFAAQRLDAAELRLAAQSREIAELRAMVANMSPAGLGLSGTLARLRPGEGR